MKNRNAIRKHVYTAQIDEQTEKERNRMRR